MSVTEDCGKKGEEEGDRQKKERSGKGEGRRREF